MGVILISSGIRMKPLQRCGRSLVFAPLRLYVPYSLHILELLYVVISILTLSVEKYISSTCRNFFMVSVFSALAIMACFNRICQPFALSQIIGFSKPSSRKNLYTLFTTCLASSFSSSVELVSDGFSQSISISTHLRAIISLSDVVDLGFSEILSCCSLE